MSTLFLCGQLRRVFLLEGCDSDNGGVAGSPPNGPLLGDNKGWLFGKHNPYLGLNWGFWAIFGGVGYSTGGVAGCALGELLLDRAHPATPPLEYPTPPKIAQNPQLRPKYGFCFPNSQSPFTIVT